MDVSMDLLEYIRDYHRAESEAVNNRELRELFNLSDRQVRNVVNALRQSGEPICSSNFGYWYSYEVADVVKTIGRLEAQVINMEKAIDGLRKSLTGGNDKGCDLGQE